MNDDRARAQELEDAISSWTRIIFGVKAAGQSEAFMLDLMP
jgi:hypothetical protein